MLNSNRRVLIANRGEIAVRIIRACRELGVETVAVYSDADRSALHVRLADRAIHIGNSPARESYLAIENLLDAAREAGADAVHPGYGFLSENAEFAQAVTDAGLTFVGPSAFSIRAMGDKAEARARMIASGVPVVPGYQGAADDEALARAAGDLGYPVLIKAAAGGGGKAMRVVELPGALAEAAGAARREAHHAFGDPRLIMEKYIPSARHVEFQILADRYGHTLHLLERECSIQRRHQKIIEETPSPLLDAGLRAQMGAAAIAAAQAVQYENAGTVEFIVDPATHTFYFLEMNTRLQVEHPITEAVTGLDLVQWQLRIAAGEPLPFAQDQIQSRGHAVECRVYAEDPANHFLPATGRVLDLQLPVHPGVRADSGIVCGDEVTSFYDPLLLKLIAHAATRDDALARLSRALDDFVLLGVTSNIAFLQSVVAHPTFRAGMATTRFVDEAFSDWRPDLKVSSQLLIAAALAELLAPGTAVSGAPALRRDPYSPWESGDGFRLGAV